MSLQGLDENQQIQLVEREGRLRMDYIFNNEIFDFCQICNDLENNYRSGPLGNILDIGPKEDEISDQPFTANFINVNSPEE